MKNFLILIFCLIGANLYCQQINRNDQKSVLNLNNNYSTELLLASPENDPVIKRSGITFDSQNNELKISDSRNTPTPQDSIRLATDIVDDPKRFNLTLSPQ